MQLKQISLPSQTHCKTSNACRVCSLVCTEFESMLNANMWSYVWKIQIVQNKQISSGNNNAGILCTRTGYRVNTQNDQEKNGVPIV